MSLSLFPLSLLLTPALGSSPKDEGEGVSPQPVRCLKITVILGPSDRSPQNVKGTGKCEKRGPVLQSKVWPRPQLFPPLAEEV